MNRFEAETYQNEYLAARASTVNAVVTVTAAGGGGAPVASATAAEVFIVDVSGSMRQPRHKIEAAKKATVAAIDCLRDGVHFGVLAGTDEVRRVFPQTDELAVASALTRRDAAMAVGRLKAGGGTAMGRWLTEARHWFEGDEAALRHAILLTDGRNETETETYFEAALEMCAGVFQCDCRGVGTDWEVEELRRVASTLLGTVDIVADPEDMPADFAAMMRQAMGKTTADVHLRLWTPNGAEVVFVKQVSPTIEDLSARGVKVDDQKVDYPTGAWGDESRDYHVCISVKPGAIGDKMLAGRVGLLVNGVMESESKVLAEWTDDVAASTRISPQVAHYTGQAELAEAISDGLEARNEGDDATATARLGRAAQLALESGNDDTLRLLARVVEIEDAASGTVRLKRAVAAEDEMALDTRSTKTVRPQPSDPTSSGAR